MNTINSGGYKLENLGKLNILLGKNGCGKSTLLKGVDKSIRSNGEIGNVKYITPERGGRLIYDPNIEKSISDSESWLFDTRRKNQLDNFRQQSIAQFRNLELLFLRELQDTESLRKDLNHKFERYFSKLNGLLDNIELRTDKLSFKIYKKGTNDEINPDAISSGESELISLGIECLVFEKECKAEKTNILLLDEPDVHLHPDLQARLSHFLREIVEVKNFIVIIATHSTAFLGALEDYDKVHIAFMSNGQKELSFKKISDEYRKILPVFGAHPLSNIFNQTPILLVEGEDDERIWQQATRSSQNKLRVYPCSTDGIDNMSQYEQDIEEISKSVYDNAIAYSIRDRDDGTAEINDLDIVRRFKLNCRNAENLLVSTEVLESLNIEWGELQKRIDAWLNLNMSHPHYSEVLAFKENGYDRKNFNLKEIRNDLMHIIGKSIAWEVAIGKALGKLISNGNINSTGDHSIFSYLGSKLVGSLFKNH